MKTEENTEKRKNKQINCFIIKVNDEELDTQRLYRYDLLIYNERQFNNEQLKN